MQPIARRLKAFIQHKGVTTSAFCRQMGYKSCEKVARLFRGLNANPGAEVLEDIALYYPELNMRWLLCGQGDMLSGITADQGATLAKV